MAVCISYRNYEQLANNWQFPTLIEFAIETATSLSCPKERPAIERMQLWWDKEYWPGRDMNIESDFPDEAERKLWSRIFYEVARSIFTRSIGDHEHDFWQAQRISQAYRVGWIFEQAAREFDPGWSAVTTDRTLFEKYQENRG